MPSSVMLVLLLILRKRESTFFQNHKCVPYSKHSYVDTYLRIKLEPSVNPKDIFLSLDLTAELSLSKKLIHAAWMLPKCEASIQVGTCGGPNIYITYTQYVHYYYPYIQLGPCNAIK